MSSSFQRAKPVKLQVNTFGATWATVVRFDAADSTAAGEVMEAAEAIGLVSFDLRSKFRIVIDDPGFDTTDVDVLYEWAPDTGWKAARHVA